MLVNDAHWADGVSLRFILYLTRRLEELSVLVVVAARGSEPGAQTSLLARLRAEPLTRVVRPSPLSGGLLGVLRCLPHGDGWRPLAIRRVASGASGG